MLVVVSKRTIENVTFCNVWSKQRLPKVSIRKRYQNIGVVLQGFELRNNRYGKNIRIYMNFNKLVKGHGNEIDRAIKRSYHSFML